MRALPLGRWALSASSFSMPLSHQGREIRERTLAGTEVPISSPDDLRGPTEGVGDPLGQHDQKCGNWRFKSFRPDQIRISAPMETTAEADRTWLAAWEAACHRSQPGRLNA